MILEDILAHILTKYKVAPENIFVKHPGVSVFRHKISKKWFALLLSVKVEKIKYDDVDFDGTITLLNLKLPPGLIVLLTDNKTFLPAYHMNKRHWISINLDSPQINKGLVYDLIKQSFDLSLKEQEI
ncbi:MmcQ/YjbR family DNA-binding protein [Campylobacter mucosalis]|uniref:Putative DNA-binding protein, MmcQ/YjbR family n=1 Tax=Campylobacter mucosalis CCUG 21559 TaxID=1032067 RepID=A0A6G5QIY0_9BACT|nr:MmcQ/YjbR family DNA-binding protein [Campylobacter mucosalis]KEA45688.1 hypothetical protein CR66_05920 [Campylobacter mucosalis]QCD45537.1 putative DNA-binding protein, MmcQ/YjbR family [Campylobacter mucosalis CCUG 21559]QKF63453.1 putative DNA-binding protein, MmcQ/YjbR family [Campylobacter mucosalis]